MTSTTASTAGSWDGVRSAIDLFILERRAERRQSRIIADYRLHLGQFFAWLTQQDVSGDGPADAVGGDELRVLQVVDARRLREIP